MRATRSWPVRAILVIMMVLALATTAFAADPTEETGTKMIECPDCGTVTACMTCYGLDNACEDCGGTNVCATCEGTGYIQSPSHAFNTALSLLPPVIAIALALLTKEVYSSLFVGILVGGMLYSNFAFEDTILHVFNDGIVASVTDSYNMGILIFLIILGTMVCLMNKAGGSAAFGRWAKDHIKTRVGAQLASILLGCLIFIDDYFNCLTVGSVMRPITDKHNISRAKLAYIIDATAAPICIIAPISSWAAAVAGFAEDGQGFNLFLRAIPYNFYALLTIVMMVGLVVLKVDFASMAKFEKNAIEKGDLFSGANPYATAADDVPEDKGSVLDLVLPVVVLIVCCVIGMIYSGGFFSGAGFIEAFSDSDASVGLMLGSAFAMVISFVYFLFRRSMSFKEMMGCIPEGFKAMVPAILILTFAWTLCSFTRYALDSETFVVTALAGVEGLKKFLPAVIFIIGCFIGFATGTSWGTIGIMAPIVVSVFNYDVEPTLCVIGLAAACAGGVCGDHCSPISDTTIMASAGAHCYHLNHVFTQLPYAATVACVSFVSFIFAGLIQNAVICLAIAVVLMVATLLVIKAIVANKHGDMLEEIANANRAA